MRSFRINEFLTLRLEKGKTNIYINGKLFRQCKYLLINIPRKQIHDYDKVESIDEAAQYYNNQLENTPPSELDISPETEFWGHCSNLQAWEENDYNPNILHSTLSLPLLRRLTEVGDKKAKPVFKEELIKRLERNDHKITSYLIRNGFLRYFNKRDLSYLKEINDHPAIKLYAKFSDFDEEIKEEIKNFTNQKGKINFSDLIEKYYEKVQKYIYFKQFIGKSIFENESEELKTLIFFTFIYEAVLKDKEIFEAYIYALSYIFGKETLDLTRTISFTEDKDLLNDLKNREATRIASLIRACKRENDFLRAKRIYSDFIEFTHNITKIFKVLILFLDWDLGKSQLYEQLFTMHNKNIKRKLILKLVKEYNRDPNIGILQFIEHKLEDLNYPYRIQNSHIIVKNKVKLESEEEQEIDRDHKVLFIGLEDTGKTSIQKLLQHQNIFQIFSLLPSRGLNIQKIRINKQNFYIWDLPGNKKKREQYLRREYVLPETNEIVYFINIIKPSRFTASLNYLNRFLNQYENYCYENSISEEKITISILFHKMDPELVRTTNIINDAERLTRKISELDIAFNYQIYYTSIYNFNNKRYNSLLNKSKIKTLRPLITKLFSRF